MLFLRGKPFFDGTLKMGSTQVIFARWPTWGTNLLAVKNKDWQAVAKRNFHVATEGHHDQDDISVCSWHQLEVRVAFISHSVFL